MGTPQQSFLFQRIEVAPDGYDRNVQLRAQRFHRNPSGFLDVRENLSKPGLLLIMRNCSFGLRLSMPANPWVGRRSELRHRVLRSLRTSLRALKTKLPLRTTVSVEAETKADVQHGTPNFRDCKNDRIL